MKTHTCLAAAVLAAGSLAPATLRGAAPPSAPATSAPVATNLGEPLVLSISQVNSDKDEGYRSTQTISGSRTLADLRDTPNSISVINRELLDDLMAVKLSEALAFSVTGEINDNREGANEQFVFRGILANLRLRNGVTWYGGVVDTYAMERVELLRGPQAFLYGEGTAGGLVNQLTKQAAYRDFQNAAVMFGSNRLYRAEFDINRRVTRNFAVRAAAVYSHEGTQQHYAERELQAVYLTANWRPFRHTNINADVEYRLQNGVLGSNLLADGYSVTERTGATTALTATTGGRTFIPALGMSYDTVGRRRSTGTNLILADERILPREINFLGPASVQDSEEVALGIHVDQKVGDALNLQASFTYFDIEKWSTERIGNSSGAIYRDTNPTLPSGAPNPYFNE